MRKFLLLESLLDLLKTIFMFGMPISEDQKVLFMKEEYFIFK